MRVPVARWADAAATPAAYPGCAPQHAPLHASQHDHRINQRFAIWQGDISTLEVDAVTNTTDSSLMQCNAVSERIMMGAGPQLKEEIITRGLECGTGEAVVTPAFDLPCRHIIHTASPGYHEKYHSAAETSLTNCYKSVLQCASDLGCRSLALCLVNTPRNNFPPDLAAHVALRCVRRHLEQHSTPLVVILVSECVLETALLSSLAPLYFPRDAREADAARARPRSEEHPERRIRIIHNPHAQPNDNTEDDTSLCDEDAAAEAAAAFARACAPDTQRLLGASAGARGTRPLRAQHDNMQ